MDWHEYYKRAVAYKYYSGNYTPNKYRIYLVGNLNGYGFDRFIYNDNYIDSSGERFIEVRVKPHNYPLLTTWRLRFGENGMPLPGDIGYPVPNSYEMSNRLNYKLIKNIIAKYFNSDESVKGPFIRQVSTYSYEILGLEISGNFITYNVPMGYRAPDMVRYSATLFIEEGFNIENAVRNNISKLPLLVPFEDYSKES